MLRKKEGQVPRDPGSEGEKNILEFHGASVRVDRGGENRGQKIGKQTKQPPGAGVSRS